MAGLTKEQKVAKELAKQQTVTNEAVQVGAPKDNEDYTQDFKSLDRYASNLQLHAGLDALGASLTVSLKKNASKIVMERDGALVYGKKSDGKIFIPYANIRGAVLI